VTRAIYLAHGIDLFEGGAADGKANGVGLIYNHLRKHGQLHRGPVVQAGDLVFFDNTWDYNGDGLVNDPLTHVGIVERVESNGTIVFISRVAGAIERYMRRKHWRDGEQTPYLTGELFAAFGTRVVESASSPDRR
jgi:hypothetical protein